MIKAIVNKKDTLKSLIFMIRPQIQNSYSLLIFARLQAAGRLKNVNNYEEPLSNPERKDNQNGAYKRLVSEYPNGIPVQIESQTYTIPVDSYRHLLEHNLTTYFENPKDSHKRDTNHSLFPFSTDPGQLQDLINHSDLIKASGGIFIFQMNSDERGYSDYNGLAFSVRVNPEGEIYTAHPAQKYHSEEYEYNCKKRPELECREAYEVYTKSESLYSYYQTNIKHKTLALNNFESLHLVASYTSEIQKTAEDYAQFKQCQDLTARSPGASQDLGGVSFGKGILKGLKVTTDTGQLFTDWTILIPDKKDFPALPSTSRSSALSQTPGEEEQDIYRRLFFEVAMGKLVFGQDPFIGLDRNQVDDSMSVALPPAYRGKLTGKTMFELDYHMKAYDMGYTFSTEQRKAFFRKYIGLFHIDSNGKYGISSDEVLGIVMRHGATSLYLDTILTPLIKELEKDWLALNKELEPAKFRERMEIIGRVTSCRQHDSTLFFDWDYDIDGTGNAISGEGRDKTVTEVENNPRVKNRRDLTKKALAADPAIHYYLPYLGFIAWSIKFINTLAAKGLAPDLSEWDNLWEKTPHKEWEVEAEIPPLVSKKGSGLITGGASVLNDSVTVEQLDKKGKDDTLGANYMLKKGHARIRFEHGQYIMLSIPVVPYDPVTETPLWISEATKQYEKAVKKEMASTELNTLHAYIRRFGPEGALQNDGKDPVLTAARAGHFDVVRYFVEKGCPVDRISSAKDPVTALWWAAQKHNWEMVEYLLDKGADANAVNGEGWGFTKPDGEFVESDTVQGWSVLILMINGNQPHLVKKALKKGARVNQPDKIGRTPLLWATIKNNIPMVQLLAEAGANPDTPSHDGWFPLYYAVTDQNKELTSVLLDRKANVNQHRSDNGYTVLHQLLLLNMKPRLRSSFMTLFFNAEIDVNSRTAEGETPLYFALLNGLYDEAERLLRHHAKPNGKTKDDQPLLYWLVIHKMEKAIRLLHRYNASMNVKDKDGVPVVFIPLQQNDIPTLTLLVELGADINVKDRHGNPIITIPLSKNDIPTLKLLVKLGADVNVRDRKGIPLVIFPIQQNNIPILQLLVELGADINCRDDHDRPPFMYGIASEFCTQSMLEEMIRLGADILAQDEDGNTALFHAIRLCRRDLLDWLIEEYRRRNGLGITNRDGLTAMTYAASTGHMNSFSKLSGQSGSLEALVLHRDKHGRNDLMQLIMTAPTSSASIIRRLARKNADLLTEYDKEKRNLVWYIVNYRTDDRMVWLANIPVDSLRLLCQQPYGPYGQTPLHDLVKENDLETLKWLKQQGVDITVSGRTGKSLLLTAAQIGSPEVFAWLTEQEGFSLTHQDEKGRNILHHLATRQLRNGDEGLYVKPLLRIAELEWNVLVTARNEEKKTPCDMAIRMKNFRFLFVIHGVLYQRYEEWKDTLPPLFSPLNVRIPFSFPTSVKSLDSEDSKKEEKKETVADREGISHPPTLFLLSVMGKTFPSPEENDPTVIIIYPPFLSEEPAFQRFFEDHYRQFCTFILSETTTGKLTSSLYSGTQQDVADFATDLFNLLRHGYSSLIPQASLLEMKDDILLTFKPDSRRSKKDPYMSAYLSKDCRLDAAPATPSSHTLQSHTSLISHRDRIQTFLKDARQKAEHAAEILADLSGSISSRRNQRIAELLKHKEYYLTGFTVLKGLERDIRFIQEEMEREDCLSVIHTHIRAEAVKAIERMWNIGFFHGSLLWKALRYLAASPDMVNPAEKEKHRFVTCFAANTYPGKLAMLLDIVKKLEKGDHIVKEMALCIAYFSGQHLTSADMSLLLDKVRNYIRSKSVREQLDFLYREDCHHRLPDEKRYDLFDVLCRVVTDIVFSNHPVPGYSLFPSAPVYYDDWFNGILSEGKIIVVQQ